MKSKYRIGAALLGLCLLSGNILAASLADLRVYDRTDGRLLPMYWHEGKAYVVGKPGNEYQLQIKNRSGGDILTVVSVDGVNVVTGETAASEQGGYVFEYGQQYDIQGWRKNLSQTAAFYFTPLPDSYAARTGRPGNVGVIGMAVYRRKFVPPPPPVKYRAPAAMPAPRTERQEEVAADAKDSRAEQEMARSDASPVPQQSAGMASQRRQESEKLGTGHGRIERSEATSTEFDRATSRPEQIFTVYYDSYRNLVARGVIRPSSPAPQSPQAFPAEARFVPDPPRY